MLTHAVVSCRVQVSAEESGVASDIVQKLIDAERDRVKLVSWSLFHPEALDMHPLESDISERTQVLEARTTLAVVVRFNRCSAQPWSGSVF
jgi:hypothetical protein